MTAISALPSEECCWPSGCDLGEQKLRLVIAFLGRLSFPSGEGRVWRCLLLFSDSFDPQSALVQSYPSCTFDFFTYLPTYMYLKISISIEVYVFFVFQWMAGDVIERPQVHGVAPSHCPAGRCGRRTYRCTILIHTKNLDTTHMNCTAPLPTGGRLHLYQSQQSHVPIAGGVYVQRGGRQDSEEVAAAGAFFFKVAACQMIVHCSSLHGCLTDYYLWSTSIKTLLLSFELSSSQQSGKRDLSGQAVKLSPQYSIRAHDKVTIIQ